MADSKPQPVRRVFSVLRHQRRDITAMYFYAVLAGMVQLSLPLGIQAIINFVLAGSVSTSLVILIIVVIAGVAINGWLQVNQMKITETVQQQLFVRYSFLYSHTLNHLNMRAADRYYLPELVNRFFDTVSLQKGISKLLLEVPAATVQIFFGLILLSFYHPVFILFGFLLLSVLYLIVAFSGRRGLSTSIEESNAKYSVAAYIEELARSLLSFKFSRAPGFHLNKTDGLVMSYLRSRTSHFKVLLTQYWVLVAFKVMITAAMLIVGAALLLEQQINIGQFIAAEIIIIMIITSVEKLIVNLDHVYDVLTSVEKLSVLPDKQAEQNGNLSLTPNDHGPSISVKNLSFGYNDSKAVLKNVSFELNAGQTLGIMGRHDSGKSTLLRVLTGAYHPFTGEINIDRTGLQYYDKQSLRNLTGIFFENQSVFAGSILENITMGNDEISLPQIRDTLEIVGLPPSIDLMTDISGQQLSSTFNRKILLARALINHPSILLLEEPWIGLEDIDARRIKNWLLENKNRSTIIVITDDPAFAAACDRLLLLEAGELKAFGDPTSVIKNLRP